MKKSMVNQPNLETILNDISSTKDNLLKLLIEITKIPSPTGFEQKKVTYLKKYLNSLNLKNIHVDLEGNCLGELPSKNPGSKKKILIVAHCDTACDPGKVVSVKESKDFIYAHGICDNTAGIVGLLTILGMIKKYSLEFPYDLLVGFTVGEEGLGAKRGMKAIIRKYGKEILAVINIESHNIGTIRNKANGQYRSKVTIDTKMGGHSYRDFGRPNSNVISAKIISEFSKYKLPQRNGKTTYNIANFSGLGNVNSIAKESSCLFEIRSENNANLSKAIKKFESIIKKYQKLYRKIEIKNVVTATNPAVKFPKNHKLYQLTIEAMKKLKIDYKFSQGNTDGDVSLAAGIPTVTLGASIGWNTHSLDEYLDKKSLVLGIQQVFLVTYKIASQY